MGDADDDADDDNDRSADALATARERRAIPMEDGRGRSAFGSLTSSSLDVGSSVLSMLVLVAVAVAVTLKEPGTFFGSGIVVRFFRVVAFFFSALISSELMACWRATVEDEAEAGNV